MQTANSPLAILRAQWPFLSVDSAEGAGRGEETSTCGWVEAEWAIGGVTGGLRRRNAPLARIA